MAPAVALFLGNMVCMCLALVQSATASQKARMKTMLSVDAFAEVRTTLHEKRLFFVSFLVSVLFLYSMSFFHFISFSYFSFSSVFIYFRFFLLFRHGERTYCVHIVFGLRSAQLNLVLIPKMLFLGGLGIRLHPVFLIRSWFCDWSGHIIVIGKVMLYFISIVQ